MNFEDAVTKTFQIAGILLMVFPLLSILFYAAWDLVWWTPIPVGEAGRALLLMVMHILSVAAGIGLTVMGIEREVKNESN